jgi:outer membrane lipoprotein LolB
MGWHRLIACTRAHARHLAGLGLAGLLSACGILTPPPTSDTPVHEGRLFLRVDTTPPSVTQAEIRLQGTPERGELTLFGPLGTTHGQLRWTPGEAVWSQGQQEQRFNNLDSLLTQTLGVTLPVHAVFAWIDGRQIEPEGWQLLSLPSAEQPLVARRLRPLPTLELRLRLAP